MKVVEVYESFNKRRYGDPWIAIVDKKTAKIDFSKKVGGYTGERGAGEAGQLYVINPEEGAIYAYGQKDYRGNNGGYQYVKFVNDEFIPIDKQKLVESLK